MCLHDERFMAVNFHGISIYIVDGDSEYLRIRLKWIEGKFNFMAAPPPLLRRRLRLHKSGLLQPILAVLLAGHSIGITFLFLFVFDYVQ